MTDVLVVAVEEIWPPRQGGQVRVAGLIEGLSGAAKVAVAAPHVSGTAPTPVPTYALRSSPGGPRLGQFVSPQPRLGQALLGPAGARRLSQLVQELCPAAVVFTHSYLAAVAQTLSRPFAVDFANIEAERLRTFAGRGPMKNRASAMVESVKAQRWERQVARRAGLCLALSDRDAGVLRGWGATVAVAPNGVTPSHGTDLSPVDGHVLFLASADYPPNREAAEWFLDRVWPLVRGRAPQARLVLAGRRSDVVFADRVSDPGVEVVGEVDEVGPWFHGAATVLAPVTTGGGQQLKVIEALSYRRVVVATSFSARSVPAGLSDLCWVADTPEQYADAVIDLISDVAGRWDRERRANAAASALPTWRTATEPLLAWLEGLR